jgi:hypothetical protein
MVNEHPSEARSSGVSRNISLSRVNEYLFSRKRTARDCERTAPSRRGRLERFERRHSPGGLEMAQSQPDVRDRADVDLATRTRPPGVAGRACGTARSGASFVERVAPCAFFRGVCV